MNTLTFLRKRATGGRISQSFFALMGLLKLLRVSQPYSRLGI